VLVDFLEYPRFTPPKKGDTIAAERQLVAFVVRHAEKEDDQVRMLPLGPAFPIARAIDVWRSTCGDRRVAIDVWRSSLGEGAAAEAAGIELRRLIWEPVEKHSNGAETILVSTDGALGRLPLGALPGKAPGTFLLEDHRLAMIPVPRLLPDLVAPPTGERKLTHELLLLGDVDYDSVPDAPPQPEAALVASTSGSRAPQVGGAQFGRLPGTKEEVVAIEKLFGGLSSNGRIVSLTSTSATEARFRALAPQCRTLHLATHGFFAPESVRLAAAAQAERPSFGEQESTVVGYSPNLLSGLAFAGANRPPSATGDDGILTAEEIAVLPLDGTRLVPLSACETGLGQTAGGEGLLGLQRAFQVSGARTTIASYWKVDDQVTRVLMERFYKNLAASTPEKPVGMLDALREAQLWVLRNPQEVAAATTRGPGAVKPLPNGGKPAAATTVTVTRSPIRLWAAFALSGDWR
jgi:CHAT domain-containing protein